MDGELLIGALKRIRRNDDVRKLSLEYNSINDPGRALFFSLLHVLRSDVDTDAIYQFLARVRSYVGVDDTISILRELTTQDSNNSDFAAALTHYLSEVGNLSGAAQAEAKCSPELVPRRFVASIIGLLLRTEKGGRALEYVQAVRKREGAAFPSGPEIMNMFLSHSTNESLTSDVIEIVTNSSTILNEHDKVRVAFFQMRTSGKSALCEELDSDQRAYLIDAVRFIHDTPLSLHHEIAKCATTSATFLEAERIEQNIFAAIENEHPYSVVRMGDGEGRYLADLSTYPQLAKEQELLAKKVWFWNSRCNYPRPIPAMLTSPARGLCAAGFEFSERRFRGWS